MDSNRKSAIVAGVLFIVATATSLAGTAVGSSLVSGSGYLARVAGNVGRMSLAGLLELIAAGTCAGIALAMYPVLRRWSPGLALGSVVFRGIEAVMYIVGALSLLSMVKIGQQFAAAPAPDRAWLRPMADALLTFRQEAVLAGVIAFVVGALMYYSIFLRSRLVPSWLAAWGLLAELLMMGACLGALFSGNPVTSYALLALPIAVQEMVLAVWLIARGFSITAVRQAGALAGAAA